MSIVYFDSSALVKVVLDEPGSDVAAELWNGCDSASTHRLGGADAVHLASAVALAPADVIVAVWDRRLHAGVVAVGLSVAPATLD